MNKRNFILLAASFSVLLFGRLWIAGTGYLEDQDEFLYIWIHQHFVDFTHLSTWIKCMFDMQGQPPEIAIRLVQYITVLPLASVMGKQMLHPDLLYFIGLYNILCSLFIIYVFYCILLKLNFTIELALVGILLLGTMVNFNLYTRHILPYDHALLFQLLSFNLLLREEVKYRTILLAGLLSAIGLTNYLGIFMFVLINGGLVVLRSYKEPHSAIKRALLFTLPFFLVVLGFELLTREYGRSYLLFLVQYSKTVNMASFDEGFNYLFRYFFQVEKWWGILILCLCFIGSYQLFTKSKSVQAKQVLLLGVVAYLSYGAYVFFSHKMVFHGRVLHIYYPFIIISVLSFLQHQKPGYTNHFSVILVLFALINYGFVINDLNSIGYPRNSVYKYHLFEEKGKVSFTYYEEMASPVHYINRDEWMIDNTGKGILPTGNYNVSNLCFNFHYPDSSIKSLKSLPIAPTDSIVFEQLHFQSHPAYAFEYCTRFGRNYFIEKQLKIRVVRTDKL